MGCFCGEKQNLDKGELKGPIEERSCRDVLWLLVFIVFWAGMFIIAGFAFAHGDYHRLLYGTDSFGLPIIALIPSSRIHKL